MNRNPGRTLGAILIVAAGLLLIAFAMTMGLAKSKPGGKDYIEYWAVEQALLHHANPYDGATILQLERAHGFDKARPEFWYSPPPALVLALPLGLLPAETGLIAWTLFHFVILSLSLWLLWQIHGRPDTLLHLFGYLFAPVVLCLEAGQISILFLLSLVLFLHFIQKSRLFWAGFALFPFVLKPHLFIVFGTALILWIVYRRAYSTVGGFATAVGTGAAITFVLDPQIWQQYRSMVRAGDMMNEYVPTLSISLRFLLDRHAIWIQFIPVTMGILWAIWYFARRRKQWDWMNHGLLVLLISVMCAPYGWFFDESVLLPAMLTSIMRARENGRTLWLIGLPAAAALVEVKASVNLMSPLYLWSTPAWVACYLYATRKGGGAGESAAGQQNDSQHGCRISEYSDRRNSPHLAQTNR